MNIKQDKIKDQHTMHLLSISPTYYRRKRTKCDKTRAFNRTVNNSKADT